MPLRVPGLEFTDLEVLCFCCRPSGSPARLLYKKKAFRFSRRLFKIYSVSSTISSEPCIQIFPLKRRPTAGTPVRSDSLMAT